MYKRILVILSSFIIFTSCDEDPLEVEVDDIEIETEFKRFDRAFFQTDTNNFEEELKKLQKPFKPFFLAGNTLENWKYQRKEEKQLHLYNDAQNVFGDMEKQNEDLNLAMKHFYYYYPDINRIHFYTYISNLDFNYPILFADTLCFAAIDLYLGENKPYYEYMPEYLAYYRQPKFLVRDCMEAIAQQIVQPPSDEASLLEQMIFYGKQMYFLEAMMPQEEKHIIIKYTPQQLEFTRSNEKNIWSYFIENNLLFSSQNELTKRFIDPAPFSKFGTKMDSETPGRIGQWLGWQIVRNYAQNNSAEELPEILSFRDAREFLRRSQYKP